MLQGKKLADFIGRNEKTKVVNLRLLILLYRNAILEMDSQATANHRCPQVIAKLQPRGSGAPGREPVLSEEERKNLMLAEFRRREELKVLW